jgi:hypothetical protein
MKRGGGCFPALLQAETITAHGWPVIFKNTFSTASMVAISIGLCVFIIVFSHRQDKSDREMVFAEKRTLCYCM